MDGRRVRMRALAYLCMSVQECVCAGVLINTSAFVWYIQMQHATPKARRCSSVG